MRVLLCLAVTVTAVFGRGGFPGATWPRRTPADAGFNAARLSAALNAAAGLFNETFCVSIHRDGFLVAEQYWSGRQPNSIDIIWSTSKAIMATLMGVAERDGRLQTSDFASKYITEWVGTPAETVTIDHLMRHDSGRYYDLINDFVIPQFVPDQTIMGIQQRQVQAPGMRDQYNQLAYQCLQRIYEVATGESVIAATRREIIGRMQFQAPAAWQMQSFFLGVPQTQPIVYGGFHVSCTDLARFGTAWMHGGHWNGQRVFSPAFYTKAFERPQRPGGYAARQYGNWGGGPNHRSNGLGGQFVSYNQQNGIVISRIGHAVNIGFNPGRFIDSIMQALDRPEEIGDYSYEEDVLANPIDPVEEELQNVLHTMWMKQVVNGTNAVSGQAQAPDMKEFESLVRAAIASQKKE